MIKIKDVSFSYPSKDGNATCLKNINIEINKGEVIVLCGESGCGKTSLTRLINGLIPNFYEGEMTGEVTVLDQNVSNQPLDITSKIVGSIFQNPRSQFFNIDTTGEVVFGCENQALKKDETLNRLKKVTNLFKLDDLLDRSIFELSGGEKQRIACASIYASEPEVFVFDEPSSNLDAYSIKLLKNAIEILIEKKKTIIIAEHRLFYLSDIATRYIYMREGKIEREFTPSEIKALSKEDRAELGLRNITLEDIKAEKHNSTLETTRKDRISIKNLKVNYDDVVALNISNLNIPLGKTVALVGANGAGKSTLANAIVGLDSDMEKILLNDKLFHKNERLKRGFMVMQEVSHQLFTENVIEEVKLNIPEENHCKIETVLEKLSLTKFKNRHPNTLSGGEKQRIAIASAVCADKKIIVYDEPTSGLDYKNMIATSSLIKEMSGEVDSSLVITHDIEFILNCCDYIIEIENGNTHRSYPLDAVGKERLFKFFDKNPKKTRKKVEEKPMKKILTYAGKNKKYIYSAIVLLFFSTVCGILPYFLLNELIVSLIEGNFIWNIAIGLILGIGISLLIKVLLYGAGLGLSHLGAFKTLYNIRNCFSKNMASHSMGHIMSEGTGKYKKSFVEDITTLEVPLAHMIPEGVPYICGTLITLIIVFVVDWRVGIALFLMIPLGFIPMIFMMKSSLSQIDGYYASKENLNNTLIEYVAGMEAIKIFNKANSSYKQLSDAVISARDFTVDWSNNSVKYMSVIYSFLPCTLLLPLPLAVLLFINGKMELGSLTLVIMLSLSLSEYLLKLINFLPSATQIGYMLKQIENVFIHDDVKSGDYSEMTEDASIEFSDVSFAYEDKVVLKNINLNIPQNSICAVVGASGSGKSTLAKLLMHFWDIEEGEIKIGNRNITDFTFENLMNHLSYVSQENTLFEGTIYENIALAKEGISREDVIKSCKKANVHDFITSLENGYDTNVGMLGGKLSGGERQRITIARAMIKNAPIVILDEATAFADAENEFLIQEALSKLLVGKTVIIIAHKLHTVVKANQIVVLSDGEILACDVHENLLKTCKTYEKLWKLNEESIDWDLGGEENA